MSEFDNWWIDRRTDPFDTHKDTAREAWNAATVGERRRVAVLDGQVRRLCAMFRENAIRWSPSITHDEITRCIDAALAGKDVPATTQTTE